MRELKYEPIERWLSTATGATVRATFATIDGLVNGLPDSARKYAAYWYGSARSARTHVWKQAWERAGFTVQTVDLARELVTFRRL